MRADFRVPVVDLNLTGKDVLALEWIDGTPLSARAALADKGFDLPRLGRALIQSFLRQAMRDGFFHADIHPGNLDSELPFGDRSFDYVTCLEGLEHIENPQQAMREFARVLKPGGHLIVSVPNILNIEERLKWLLHGYTSHFKPISRASS